ncbi:invasion associated locus B family protein [Rhodobacter sp. NTK016B]|nr:invasion associated locus B family protein [Rhodobacter sp. NTK016B]
MFRSAMTTGLVSALLVAAAPAFAQEEGAAAGAPAAQSQGQQPEVVATHADWQVVCAPEAEGQPRQCEMYQLLRDGGGSPIAEFSIAALPLGAEFAAGATITTPLETFLPTGLGFRIGDAEDMRVEGFRVCTVVGCVVRMGLSGEEVDQLKAGSNATVTIAPFIAIDQPIEINVSLSGFTAAYDELQTRFAEAAAAARTGE